MAPLVSSGPGVGCEFAAWTSTRRNRAAASANVANTQSLQQHLTGRQAVSAAGDTFGLRLPCTGAHAQLFEPMKDRNLSSPDTVKSSTNYQHEEPYRVLQVGVDLDNVCYPFPAVLRRWIHMRTGKPFEEMPEPSTWHFYETEWGVPRSQYLQLVREAVDARFLFLQGMPLPGSVEAIRALARRGHQVHIVTARSSLGIPGVAEELTHQWLQRWRIPYNRCILAGEKGLAGTELGLDTAIDDASHHYDEYEQAGIAGFLLDCPWNAQHPGRRVADWSEYVEVVEQLASSTASTSPRSSCESH